MGSLLSGNKRQDDDYAASVHGGPTTRVETYSSLYGGYPAVSTNVGSYPSYPTGTWTSTPSVRSAVVVHSIKRPSTSYYSLGGSIATSYDTLGAVNSASSERYGHADIKPSYPTDTWSSVSPRSSSTIDRTSTKGFSAEGGKSKRYSPDWAVHLASNKNHADVDVKSTSYPPKSYTAVASARSAAARNRNSSTSSGVSSVKPMEPKRHVPGKYKSASTRRNHSCDSDRNPGDNRRRIATYGARGGGRVVISVPLNLWQVLGLHSSDVSREAIKAAFKMKINQPVRQNRAMVSIAHHMLTSAAGRYRRIEGKDEFVVTRRDHFMLAACGHTHELTLRIAKKENIVAYRDEHGRTLLYIASKSGFYDTCKLLLQKGASVNEPQRDGSTPLHGAAYFGHELVVGLLLQHGAKSDIKNKWGNTAIDESATAKIRNLIQTASADDISSLAATLNGKQLVHSVRLIEFQGEVIAKELTRDTRSLDARTRGEWNDIHNTWETAWHGTRYKYLASIIDNGLLPAGDSGIKPAAGHYSLCETHFGIQNWAAAIFLSPSILYAAHACYSDRIFSESQQWCVLVKAYCKPGSYKSYDPTVFRYKPMDG